VKRKIEFSLGGEDFILIPNFEALAALEDKAQESTWKICQEVTSGTPRLTLLIRVIYAGLQGSDDLKWTEKKLGDFLIKNRFSSNQKLMTAVVSFLTQLLMAGEDNEEEKKTEAEPVSQNLSSKLQPET
jgi:hypothetical protein